MRSFSSFIFLYTFAEFTNLHLELCNAIHDKTRISYSGIGFYKIKQHKLLQEVYDISNKLFWGEYMFNVVYKLTKDWSMVPTVLNQWSIPGMPSYIWIDSWCSPGEIRLKEWQTVNNIVSRHISIPSNSLGRYLWWSAFESIGQIKKILSGFTFTHRFLTTYAMVIHLHFIPFLNAEVIANLSNFPMESNDSFIYEKCIGIGWPGKGMGYTTMSRK